MKIEVRKIKFVPGHDDSHSYTADIYINDVKAFEASNGGWGGPDLYRIARGYDGPDEQEISAWLAANTPKTGLDIFPEGMDNCLEFVVGDALNAASRAKEVNSIRRKFDTLLKKKVFGIKDGALFSWKVEPTLAGIARVRNAKPDVEIVNGNDDLKEKALLLYCPDLAEMAA